MFCVRYLYFNKFITQDQVGISVNHSYNICAVQHANMDVRT